MPLIMLCGGPLSGKTLLTKKIEQRCQQLYPDRECKVLSHETLNISRLVFKDMPTEKKFNQKILSMVEQALTSRRVLIVDFICLTKSLRYQLYGKANFTGTVSCVVHCTTPYEATAARNQHNTNANGQSANDAHNQQYYTPEIFEDLWNRLETPLDTCKWDYPCFPIDCSDLGALLPAEVGADGETAATADPNDALWTQILTSICEQSKKTVSRSNLATRGESGGFVAVLDKITTSIVEQLIRQQQAQGFVVGALLETQSITVPVDISAFLSLGDDLGSNPSSPLHPATPTEPQLHSDLAPITTSLDNMTLATPVSSATPVVSPSTPSATGGLKLVRKAVRGKKVGETTLASPLAPSGTTTPVKSVYNIVIKNPITPSGLFELKQSFTRIATMMNLKSADQMAKAFVEYLQPQLNPL